MDKQSTTTNPTVTAEPTNAGTSNETILKLSETVKALESKIAGLEETKKNSNPITSAMDNDNKKLAEEHRQQYLTSFYGDAKVAFDKALGGDSKRYNEMLKNINNIEDKIKFVAEAVITKAFGDSEETKAKLASFKTPVTNVDSAFNAMYQSATEKLTEDNISINASLLNARAGDISLLELKKIHEDIARSSSRASGLARAKALNLIN